LTKKYKQLILVTVIAAVILVLGLSNLDLFTAGEEVPAEITADEELSPTDQPYQTYEAARAANKPIFLEFYASW